MHHQTEGSHWPYSGPLARARTVHRDSGQAPILPAMMSLQTTGNYAACGCLPGRAVLDKSHNRQARSARRVVIEATFTV